MHRKIVAGTGADVMKRSAFRLGAAHRRATMDRDGGGGRRKKKDGARNQHHMPYYRGLRVK